MSKNGGDDDIQKAAVPGDGAKKRMANNNAPPGGFMKNKKQKRLKTKGMDPQVLEFRRLIQQCCKRDDVRTALTAYDEAVAAGTRIEAQTFYNLLNLCDGLGERGIHIGTPKQTVTTKQEEKKKTTTTMTTTEAETKSKGTADDATRLKYPARIKAHMDEVSLPLTEAAYTALVRLYSRSNNVEYAEMLLDQAEKTQQCKPKVRMYAALLHHYCCHQQAAAAGDELYNAVRIWLRVSQQGLVWTEKEYASLLQCCVKTGNAVVTERVLSDLAQDVFVPSRETCQAIIQWFESPHAVFNQEEEDISPKNQDEVAAKIKEMLDKIQNPFVHQRGASMGPVQCNDAAGWVVSRVCTVDDAGVLQSGCLEGASLKPVSLSDEAWQDMKRMNETIATLGDMDEGSSEFQGGGKGRKRPVDSKSIAKRQKRWKEFQDFLDKRSQKRRIDVILDGANLGYYEANFENAPKHVDYNRIDSVIKHFGRLDKSVLLIMHSRHFSSSLMPEEARPLMEKWMESGVLFQTPPGMNDDWFWLHAALYAGPGTLVVTNDEMRDHHFQMVAPRSFLCWRDRHQVHFGFGGWIKNEREVLLTYPDRYSRRIQRVLDGLVVPLPKRGDENRFLDGAFVADSDVPVEETYLCIRPSRRPET